MSPSDDAPSVTVWFDRLRDGDPDAAAALWDRFFGRLVAFARGQLGDRHRRVADEEDIAAEVMAGLCEAADRGALPAIDNRDDLWRMLLCWTRRGVIDHVRHQTRAKRGGGDVRGDSIADGGLDRFADDWPAADTLAEMDERLADLLGRLPSETLRTIAVRRLHGWSTREIAEQLDLSPRTIERKLAIVRAHWGDESA